MKWFRIFYLSVLVIGSMPMHMYAQESVTVHGNIYSADDHHPVPYATIIDISSYENGTTTAEDGSFRLKILKPPGTPVRLRISSVGFQDTIVSLEPEHQEKIEILLSSRTYSLPEISIQRSSLSERTIGIPDGEILRSMDGEPLGLIPSKTAGYGSGVFIKIPGDKRGIVKSIEYYLTPAGKPETPFIMRFMAANEPLEHNRMYSFEMFSELIEEPIVTTGRAGWNELSLVDYNIPVQGNDLFIFFIPIEGGDRYKWQEGEEEWYGMVLGRFKKRKVKGLYWAMRGKGTYSYDDTPFQRGINPAVVLRYLAEK